MSDALMPLEYWLLDAAVETSFQVRILIDTESVEAEAALNRRIYRASPDQWANALMTLYQRGYVCFLEASGARCGEIDDIGGLKENADISYRLTEEGGAAWESFAQPDWSKYIADYYTHSDSGGAIRRVCSLSKSCIERMILLEHRLSPGQPAEAACWTLLEPWDATYWKRLPAAHQVTFEYGDVSQYIAGPVYDALQLARYHWNLSWSMWRSI